MNLIIGPTRPPSACLPNPPIPSTGVKPFSMKKAVMNPQAMNAAMFGMIMPERKVPNFCTATRALFARLAGASAFTAMLCLHSERRARPSTCSHRAPSRQVDCRAYRTVCSASGPESPDRSTSTDRGGAGQMRVVRFHAPQDVRVEDTTLPRRPLPRGPPRLADGLPQPGADRLPARRRLRRAHAGPGQGAGRRRRQPPPRGMSFAEASVAEPLSCVLNGQEQAGVGDGQTVVVVGAGPIGCLHVRLARARGAARVLL